MSNAPKILGDDTFIRNIFEYGIVDLNPKDDKVASIIKKYINQAYLDVKKYELVYKIHYKEWEKYLKKGMPRGKEPKHHYWWIGTSEHYVELKVNHIRQKYWYWKKLN